MKMQDMYFDFLTSQGFRPEKEEDGDVRFRFQGKHFFISIQESDETYFRVIMPNFWQIDSEQQMARALMVSNHINVELKVGKVNIVKNQVWAYAEMFIEENPDLDQFFLRTVDVVKTAADRFVEKMREKESLVRHHLN